MVRPQIVLDSWKAARKETAHAVLEFPPEAMDEVLVPDVMSFRDTARHILEAGYALTGVLLDGIENLATPEFRPSLAKYVAELPKTESPEALAEVLQTSVERRSGQLLDKDADFYAHEITRFDGARVTRLEMLQFVKEHELTHRSQLFMFLRLKGMVPATTRRRKAAQKA